MIENMAMVGGIIIITNTRKMTNVTLTLVLMTLGCRSVRARQIVELNNKFQYIYKARTMCTPKYLIINVRWTLFTPGKCKEGNRHKKSDTAKNY